MQDKVHIYISQIWSLYRVFHCTACCDTRRAHIYYFWVIFGEFWQKEEIRTFASPQPPNCYGTCTYGIGVIRPTLPRRRHGTHAHRLLRVVALGNDSWKGRRNLEPVSFFFFFLSKPIEKLAKGVYGLGVCVCSRIRRKRSGRSRRRRKRRWTVAGFGVS